MLPLLGLILLMPDALQLHLMRCLEFGQLLGIAGRRVLVVELMLHDTEDISPLLSTAQWSLAPEQHDIKGSKLAVHGCAVELD